MTKLLNSHEGILYNGINKIMRLNRFRNRTPLIFAIILLLSMSKTSTQTNGYLTDNYKNLEGEIVSLDNFKGSQLVIFAMATWCGPCIEQHYEIAKIYKLNYSNFEILTLSIDRNETLERMIEYSNSYGNPWSIGIILNDSSFDNFNINALPTLLFFNSEGRLLSQTTGYTEFAELDEIIEKFISTSDSRPQIRDVTSTTSENLTIGYPAYSVVSLIIFSTIFSAVCFRKNKY